MEEMRLTLLDLIQIQRLMLDQRPRQPLQLDMLTLQQVLGPRVRLLDEGSDLTLDSSLRFGTGDGISISGMSDRSNLV